jgi:translation elongation factor EF-G
MQVTVKANFNKQSKDSKKELIQFYVKGADENKQEINQLCREVVELEIEGVGQKLICEFSKSSKDANKTVLDFIVKGDTSADKSFEFYRKAGSDVTLNIVESQMSIDEFHDGLEYSIDKNGNVEVSDDQVSFDDLDEDPEDDDLLN